jgi:tetratricopeptide (TPR) repeat protein
METEDLLRLLKAAQQDGARVLWVAVSDGAYTDNTIPEFQAAIDPARPLDTLRRTKLNSELVRIASMIAEDPQSSVTFPIDPTDELKQFIGNYGDSPTRQSVEAAATDVQLKTFALTLATQISSSECGTIVDIGCGSGILLQRLVDLESFKRASRWVYVASDHNEVLEEVLQLATKLRIHRRVEVLPLELLHSHWVKDEQFSKPTIVVVRNVFHELNIVETAKLLNTIANSINWGDLVLIQDLQVFPSAERGNACWNLSNFVGVLTRIGMSAVGVEEPTRSGNQWFTLVCHRTSQNSLDLTKVTQIVIDERSKQYHRWTGFGSLVLKDNRSQRIALLDLDLQLAALQKQLLDVNAPTIEAPTPDRQRDIASKTFAAHLDLFDVNEFSKQVVSIEAPPNFRDRRNSQNELENFIRDDAPLALIVGGPFMGKTYLVSEVLSRRAYERHVVMLDAQITSSVWNLLEQYLAAIGCAFSYEVVANFRDASLRDIESILIRFIEKVSRWTIVVIDHFERLLDPKGSISDPEIARLLECIVSAVAAKVILTSRRPPLSQFIPGDFSIAVQPPIGRFPEGKEDIEHLLDDFVSRVGKKVQYPSTLFEAIDRYPYLAALAGRIIRKEGIDAFGDPKFFDLLRLRLREDLLKRIVTSRAQPAIELLSLLRIPIPRRMFEQLAGVDSVREAEDLGLLYTIKDRASEYLTGVTVLRPQYEELKEDEGLSAEHGDVFQYKHQQITWWYSHLYRRTDDPRWIREAHYHVLASGDIGELHKFGVAYKSELFAAGEYWFRSRRDFKASLEAFFAAKRLGLVSVLLEMRIAGCLMRSGRVEEGEERYRSLIAQYDTSGLKSSYIDSLLYIRDFSGALDRLEEYGFQVNDGPWTAHQYGRTYLGKHMYKEAIHAFKVQLSLKPESIAYHMLARSHHRAGERIDVDRVLSEGLKRYTDDKYLKLDYAAHLIRMGDANKMPRADQILRKMHQQSPTDGKVLQQFVRMLCATGRVREAEEILKQQKWRIEPERYRLPIEVTILLGERRYVDAITKLRDIPNSDEHLLGMKKKAYLWWSLNESDSDERKVIATSGLNIPIDAALQHNIPIMVTSARLAKLAEDDERFEQMVKQIEEINSGVADLLRQESQELGYWEEDALDL